MRQITLGRSGLSVSRIAFGTWQLGGDWGPTDAETAVERIMKDLNLDTKRLAPRSVAAAISAAWPELDAWTENVVTLFLNGCRGWSAASARRK